MKQLCISLVTCNHARYIPYLCDSLRAQSFQDWDMTVIDNNSSDNTVELLREHLPQATVVRQKVNLGFSRAHNLAITWCRSPYILIINPDVILEPDCLERLLGFMDRTADAASAGARLLYWNFDALEKTAESDSLGIGVQPNYRLYDMQSPPREGKDAYRVFGVTGALCMLRKSALESVKVPKFAGAAADIYEYFDEDFFAYKEDADLAWRLNLYGWKNYIAPDAVAFHHRAVSKRASSRADRVKRSAINRLSYRNHLLTVYKNHFWRLTLRRALPIILFELQKFVYLATLDRSSMRGLGEVLKLLPRMRRKRAFIQKHRVISPSQFIY